MSPGGRMAWLVLAAGLLAGCGRRTPMIVGPYRLDGAAGNYVLHPPVAPQAGVLRLEQARTRRGRDAACGVASDEITLRWRGRRAEVTLSAKAAGSTGPVMLEGPVRVAGEAATDLGWWTRFGEELDKRETAGCLGPREARPLAGRILENLPVTTGLAYRLRYGNYAYSGYFDLEPQFVLKSVAPLLKPGVERFRTVEDVRGYETVYYELRERRGGGLGVRLLRAEQNAGGTLTTVARPVGEVLRVPESARFLRLFFRAWSVGGDRRIAILGTRAPDQLAPATKRFEAAPEEYCLKPGEGACISVPRDTVIGPELRVKTNRAEGYVPVGGTVADLLRGLGVKASPEVVRGLRVTRLYQGTATEVEFDREKGDILRLVLIGGETVTW